MTSYHAFARLYDAVQGDRAEPAALLRQLIEKHDPSASTVLGLAYGTGSILKQLQPTYNNVTGHLLVIDVRPSESNGVVIWGFRVFEHQSDGRYLLHSERLHFVATK